MGIHRQQRASRACCASSESVCWQQRWAALACSGVTDNAKETIVIIINIVNTITFSYNTGQ
jgi:hypothetical protein